MGGGVFEFRCLPQPQALGFQCPLLFPSAKPSASTPSDSALTAFAVLIDLKEGMGGQAFGVAVSYLELDVEDAFETNAHGR
uniref:Uncharacterized protein n=1 Tax=Fagus sylvatica TaxID=28930 RepID=A0A2N9J9B3_FAGSY